MAGRPTEGSVHGAPLTTKYSAETQNDCDQSENGSATAQTVARWLSEWTGDDADVRGDGSVTVSNDALPLPSLSNAQTLKSSGWRFDGLEGHDAVYRRVDQ